MTAKKIKEFTRSPAFYNMVLTALAIALASYVGLYGKDKFFPKERGEAVEKEQIKIQADLEHRHQLHLLEQKHTNEKLDDLKIMIKAYYEEKRNN